MYRSALVSPLLGAVLATVLLTGCSGETPVRVTAGSGEPAGSSPAEPSSAGTTAADPSAAPTTPAPAGHQDPDDGGPADGGAGTSAAPAGRSTAPTTTAPTTTAATQGPVVSAPGTGTPAGDPSTDGGAGAVVWPPEASPVHGGQVWAVYLAVGSPDSDWDRHMLGEAEGYLIGHGYTGSGIGEVGCDQGAAEQLGFDPGDHRLAVYFDSAARAQEFVGVYDRQDLGSARVTTYCLD